ncbi:hypothetical protein [Streptomyces sp. CBMA29]|uniref:hypothetical protein n=1 Tax=Streptomyces sp. CBMA29 TaxID=1896314 RepID=UPI001661E91F|nr:hypothetical protein [Streptomyces sp. CBMA29]MBD0737949.1 hypothetical protein [Streptomyces sp. CBMA29]
METADQPVHPAGRRTTRPGVLIAVLVIALAVTAALVLTGHGRDHSGSGAGGPADKGAPGAGSAGFGSTDPDATARLHADAADLLVLEGVSGRVRITADPSAHTVSGTYHRPDGGAARVRGVVDDAAGLRTLTLVCGTDTGDGGGGGDTAGSCAGDLTLTVPEKTGLRLRQTSGETLLEGLGGRLTVDVASDRLTAHALHPSHADFAVTSSSADLGFSAAPDTLAVVTTSASTAVRLPVPSGDAYAVTTAATSADVQVKVPNRDGAAHRVTLTVHSGSLAVLPA